MLYRKKCSSNTFILKNFLFRINFDSSSAVEVCKSDRISEQKYTYRIGLIKLFRSRIGFRYSKKNELNIHALLQELIIHAFIKALSRLSLHFSFDTSIGRHFDSFLTCISCFYIYLVKHFNLNEKFILLKDSSDRIEILYHNSDRIRIRQFRIGF
jgi:hypothetical protein